VRDTLHILDLFDLVDYEIHNFDKVNGHTFNAGGGLDCSVSLRELTDICADITGNKTGVSAVPENRKGDIPIYITDNARITTHTGWKPKSSVQNILTDIFNWINKNEKQLKPILNS